MSGTYGVVKKVAFAKGVYVFVTSNNEANAKSVAAQWAVYDPNQDPIQALQMPDATDPALAVDVSFIGSL